MLVDPPADQDDLGGRVMFQFGGDGRTVGYKGEGEITRERSGDLGIGRASVEENRLTGLDQRGRQLSQPPLLIRRQFLAGGEVGQGWSDRQCASVDAGQQTFRRHLPKIASDCILRQCQFLGKALGDQPAIAPQTIHYQGLAFECQHLLS